MRIGVFDSLLHQDQFSTPAMREIFSDEAVLQSWLDVEAALARTQGELGIIPQAAADDIVRKANLADIDVENISQGLRQTGHPFVPLVNELTRICDVQAQHYVHWGATSQDMMDTALVLRLREATSIISGGLRNLSDVLAEMAGNHRGTLMVGRTNGQHALPITFGIKIARWVEEIDRSTHRLREVLPRLLMVQFTGAAGTLASLGEAGPTVQAHLAKNLDLGCPVTSWHTSRDSFSELLSVMAIIANTVGRLADELYTMHKPEIAEAREEFPATSVGSSTMPHKQNPFHLMEVSGLCRLAASTTAQWFSQPGQDGERDARNLFVENDIIPRALLFTEAALSRMNLLLGSLHIDTVSMSKHLEGSRYLVLTERLMMELGKYVGRSTAHSILHDVVDEARESGANIEDLLSSCEIVAQHLSPARIHELFELSTYTGQSGAMVDRLLAEREYSRVIQ